MRYPAAQSNEDFLKYWYDAQQFGSQTSYGYHEGHDYNTKTGGDSDLGQPLYAVAKGKIVYYHNASHSTSGFGRHMVLECETIRGKRWYMYSHCQEITSQVKEVNEGDVIGKLGKSGTTTAHLHFSVFKVDPSTLYKGIDSIAKTKEDLNAYWEKFELLGTVQSTQENMAEKTYTKAEWQIERDERNKNWDLYQDQLKETQKFKDQYENTKKEADSFLETLAEKLKSIVDRTAIIGSLGRLLETEDQLVRANKKLDQMDKAHAIEKEQWLKEMDSLRVAIGEQQKQNELLLKRIDVLEGQIAKNKQSEEFVEAIRNIFNNILKKFKKE